MTIVKELNELAEKMTGVNPRATTDAQAMDFIEQHYKGGDTPSPTPTPQSKFDYIIPKISYDPSDSRSTITDTDIISVLEEISTRLKTELEPLIIGCYLHSSDGGEDDFITLNYSISPDTDYVHLEGISYTFGLIFISYTNDNWVIMNTSL